MEFSIDNFLNAEPVHVKTKKGVDVLDRPKANVLTERSKKEKYNVTPSRIIQ